LKILLSSESFNEYYEEEKRIKEHAYDIFDFRVSPELMQTGLFSIE